jgi:hypothetical protein
VPRNSGIQNWKVIALRRSALRFIVLLGIVSLFADMTYESARSITGPYLALLGASATVVGIVSGFGELVGYAIRLVSGYVSDRTVRYWPVTCAGADRTVGAGRTPHHRRADGQGHPFAGARCDALACE